MSDTPASRAGAGGGPRDCGPRPHSCTAAIEEVSRAVLALTQHVTERREVLQTVVESARSLIGARYAALGVPDDRGSFAEFVVDGVSDQQWRRIGPLPRQHGLLGVMLREAKPQRLADIREDPRFEGWPAAHPELSDFLGMPIVDGGEILGTIYLANKDSGEAKGGGFTEDDERLLGLLAAHAAIALTNARLFERSRELTLLQERNRIARELHDAVAQKLFSLRLTAEAAAALVGRDPARVREELAGVRSLAAEALDELRAVVVELRPADLAEDGLVATLRKQVEVLDRVQEASVTFEVDGRPHLSPSGEQVVLRVAQEAVRNACQHAGAQRVWVRLRELDHGAGLEVGDNGKGFDRDQILRSDRSLGVASMRERARSVGGRLVLSTEPGQGTRVWLEVPGE